jgi:hypothetical protein
MGRLVEQVGRGIPGSEVTCQQETKPLKKIQISADSTSPQPIKIN